MVKVNLRLLILGLFLTAYYESSLCMSYLTGGITGEYDLNEPIDSMDFDWDVVGPDGKIWSLADLKFDDALKNKKYDNLKSILDEEELSGFYLSSHPLKAILNLDDPQAIKALLNSNRGRKGINSKINGWPLLLYAIKGGKYNSADVLIKSGADVNARGNEGLTALHLAVLNNRPELVKLLLDNGANRELHNKKDLTPLDSIKDLEGYDEVKELLASSGADEQEEEGGAAA